LSPKDLNNIVYYKFAKKLFEDRKLNIDFNYLKKIRKQAENKFNMKLENKEAELHYYLNKYAKNREGSYDSYLKDAIGQYEYMFINAKCPDDIDKIVKCTRNDFNEIVNYRLDKQVYNYVKEFHEEIKWFNNKNLFLEKFFDFMKNLKDYKYNI